MRAALIDTYRLLPGALWALTVITVAAILLLNFGALLLSAIIIVHGLLALWILSRHD
jgi:hypothetical protein